MAYRQIALTLKITMKLAEMNNTKIINNIISNANLEEKHEKILNHQVAKDNGANDLSLFVTLVDR